MANQLKKLISIEPSGIKKIAGVPLASVKKVAGVLYEASTSGGLTLPFQYANQYGRRAITTGGSTGYVYFNWMRIIASMTLSRAFWQYNFNTTAASATNSYNYTYGIYQLTGASLSLLLSGSNAVTVTRTNSSINNFFTLTFSNTLALNPNSTYFIAYRRTLVSYNFLGESSSFNNGPFLQFARMTATTSALPSTIETSVLDVSGSDVTFRPSIILSSI